MTAVVGTAGHIDHGKTTLLRALTGIDADRLPEERARGMTIDVGYAHLAFDDGTELDFVDVPGHDRLVGNMLVGAGEIDAALLVVAADDGPRAQTIEHLELLDGLGISDGLVVVTKIDSVEASRVAAVTTAIRTLVDGTALRGAPILPVSGVSGSGLPALRAALRELRDQVLARAPVREAVGPSLAIDRVFTIRGRGTVVTGTLRGGAIEPGDVLRVVPAATGTTVRVREVQVHGRQVERGLRGRVALNLAGDAAGALARGAVLTADPSVVATDRLLVAVRPVAAGSEPPRDRSRVAVHLGTAHVGAVVARSGGDDLALGEGAVGTILRLDDLIAVAPGDPFVLRRPSPAATLAGGRVLDPDPPRGVASRRATPGRLLALAGAPPGGPAWHAARLDLHGALPDAAAPLAGDVGAAMDDVLVAAVPAGDGARSAALIRSGTLELRRRVGPVGPAAGRLVGDRLDGLLATGRLVRDGDRVRHPGERSADPSPELRAAMDRLVTALSSFAPPPLSEAARTAGCPDAGVRRLEQDARIVRLDGDLAWASSTYRELIDRAVAMAADGVLTPAAYRDATGTSRKYVMAILEDLDRRAFLRRTPSGHVLGPRAPRPAEQR